MKAAQNAETPNPKTSTIKRKTIFSCLALAAIPLAGFTYAYLHFNWNHAHFQFDDSSKPNGNIFTAADPAWFWSMHISGDQTIGLSQARSIANFPIRTLGTVPDWNHIVSEGVKTKITDINGTKVSIEDGPMYYLDVYTNDKGQRIGVTQEFNSDITHAETNSKTNVSFLYSKYSKTLGGFGNDVAVFSDLGVGGPWKVPTAPKAFQGNSWAAKGDRKEIDLYHREENGSITLIKLYGDTSLTILETFAHWYVDAPTH